MNILTNKYFILGNLLLLLISIPVTLFFIKRQQELRSRAAPSSKLYFTPETINTSTQCSSFTTDVMVNPGQNIVSIVDFYLTYDPTRLDVIEVKESTSFPTIIRPISITSGETNMSVSIGSDVTRAVQTVSKVATITFRAKAIGTTQIQFDAQRSRVFSLAPSDEPTENVLSTTSPSNIVINSDACLTDGEPTPSVPSTTITPSATPGVGGGGSPTPTTAPNQPPACTELSVSPAATGSAPFSVLFTAKGNDPDTSGLISKTTFNFGDGQIQDITDGMNLKAVTVQTNHTFQNAGTFGSTVTFTDNHGAVSQSCTKTLTVSGASDLTSPTPTVSTDSGQLTATPTEVPISVPTIPPTGGLASAIGIVGIITLTIIAGFLLFAL